MYSLTALGGAGQLLVKACAGASLPVRRRAFRSSSVCGTVGHPSRRPGTWTHQDSPPGPIQGCRVRSPLRAGEIGLDSRACPDVDINGRHRLGWARPDRPLIEAAPSSRVCGKPSCRNPTPEGRFARHRIATANRGRRPRGACSSPGAGPPEPRILRTSCCRR